MKKGLSRRQHEEVAVTLKSMYDRLQGLFIVISRDCGKTAPETRIIQRALASINGLRAMLDARFFKECPNTANTKTYYPGDTAHGLKASFDAEAPFADGQRWGIWSLDKKTFVLRDPGGYEIDLERCTTPARMLDWIMQVTSKPAVYSNEDVGDLVRALDNILRPQATLCSFGQSKELTCDAIRRMVGS